jgi:hypothetical protein
MTGKKSKRKAAQAKLAQSVQKPVTLMDALKDAFYEGFTSVSTYNDTVLNCPEEAWAKYTPPAQPPQRTWVGLTDEQIKAIDEMALTKNMAIAMTMRTLKEKNT